MDNHIPEKLKDLRKLAKEFDWKELDYQPNIEMVSFQKYIDGYTARINIYMTKMTVATIVNHPKLGRQTLYRKHQCMSNIKTIFKNPRVHTPHGYHTK